MAFSVTEFQGQMEFGGARPSLFECNVTNPFDSTADDKFRFMCRTGQIPTSTVGVIPIAYFGRPVKFAGNRIFDPWTVTIINDEDFAVRNSLEEWHNNINQADANVRAAGAGPESYKSQATVIHYGKQGNVIREYKLIGIFPSQIAPIELDWSNEGLEEFQVTFEFDYFTSS